LAHSTRKLRIYKDEYFAASRSWEDMMFNRKIVAAFVLYFCSSSAVFAVENIFRLFATQNGKQNYIFETNNNNFAPGRFFAWEPNLQSNNPFHFFGGSESTVIRGGYGIYYDTFFTNATTQTAPFAVDRILVDQNGNYSLGSSKTINRPPTNPFTFAGTNNEASNRFFLLFNRNQDPVVQTFGPTQNFLGAPRVFLNNPAGLVPTGGCMTQNLVVLTQFSSTLGNLLFIDDHNNGKPIPGTQPTAFRFTGPDLPISVGCWQRLGGRLDLSFQLYRAQGGRQLVRTTGRRFQFQNNTWASIGPQRFFTPWTPVNAADAYKYRFNTTALIDRNQNGVPDAIAYVKPKSTGSDIFARGINETTLAANTSPKKISPNTSDQWWALSYLGRNDTTVSICLQDDSNPSTKLTVNLQTGAYQFNCGGSVFTGRGTITLNGSSVTVTDNSGNTRLSMNFTQSTNSGTASFQPPTGGICTITDRNTSNNTCN
jgi:hypothetical protein